jgi:hypothetical protein
MDSSQMKETHLLFIKFPDILPMNYTTALHPKSGIRKHSRSPQSQTISNWQTSSTSLHSLYHIIPARYVLLYLSHIYECGITHPTPLDPTQHTCSTVTILTTGYIYSLFVRNLLIGPPQSALCLQYSR